MPFYNPQHHQRKSIRLKGYDYSSPGEYFITICTKDRECLFGEIKSGKIALNETGKIAEKIWKEIPEHFSNTELDEFIVMPNHVHGIISIIHDVVAAGTRHDDKSVKLPGATELAGAIHELPLLMKQRRKMLLPKIIGWFKMNSAKQINQIHLTYGMPVWQRNYYDHIIRNKKELLNIRQYIIDNPVNWGDDEDNPYKFS